MSELNIAQIMAGARHGGAETFFVTLGQALARAGIRQHFYVRPHAERLKALAQTGAPVTGLAFGGRLDIATGLRLKHAFSADKPTAVLTWMNRAADKCPAAPAPKIARLGGYYDLKHYRRHDHMIGITPGLCRFIREGGFPADRVHFIPNFCRVEDDEPASRTALDTPEDASVVLALGRLHPVKGLDVLLHAVAELPEVYLWLAGEGPLRDELERLAADLGVAERVRFLGWRTDRSALMRSADLCAFPSRYEPNGTVVVEAWAHGVPLVSTASSGPSEYIRDGKDGFLVPVDDAHAMAKAMRRVLSEPVLAADFAGAGLERVAKDFSEQAVVAAYRHLFETVKP